MPSIPSQIGRYDILELVGRGGMGVLYRARDPILERDVALKMMHVDFHEDANARERFQREAKAVARLQHRNVVTIHELGEVDGTPYIVMEFLGGRDLEKVLKAHEPMTVSQKLDIAIQLCDGLAYAHDQGIVHRDIKPGNIRLLDDGTVKILDFGIAKFAMSSMTQSGTVMGTPSYMAPEQVMGQPIDGRADLFAVGVVLYELLSGKKPFVGDTPTAVAYQIMHGEPASIREAVPGLPDAINEIVARALRKNPSERYARATDMAADLQIVRLNLDLPLHGDRDALAETAMISPVDETRLAPPKPTSAEMQAGARNLRMRSSAADAAADAAPEGRRAPETPSSTKLLAVGGVVVAVLVLASLLFMRSGGNPAEPAPAPAAAAPAAPAPATEVLVSSVPAGARILRNGEDTGQVTPSTVAFDALPGELELALDGYETASASVSESEAEAGRLEVRLSAVLNAVRLTVTGDYPFEVRQGSTVLSALGTRHEVTVQPNGGSVTVRNSDLFLNSTLSIDYRRSTSTQTVPAAGTLAVFAARETCAIAVDDQSLGFPPIPGRTIASGQHRVTLQCPDEAPQTQPVNIQAGELARVEFRN